MIPVAIPIPINISPLPQEIPLLRRKNKWAKFMMILIHSFSRFLALSQPNTPRPKHVTHDDTTTDDSTLSSQSNERVSNFALAQLATDPTQPQRLNDGDPSMFNFETGPTFTPTKQHLDIWNMDRTNG